MKIKCIVCKKDIDKKYNESRGDYLLRKFCGYFCRNIWMRGKNHPAWKGNNATYRSIHDFIINNFGEPKYCEHCKRTDKKKYEWASKDHKYTRNIKDYQRLCTSCHRRYDYKNNI